MQETRTSQKTETVLLPLSHKATKKKAVRSSQMNLSEDACLSQFKQFKVCKALIPVCNKSFILSTATLQNGTFTSQMTDRPVPL